MNDLASIFVQPLVDGIIDIVGSLIKEGFVAIQGVKKEVEKLSINLTTIRAVLKDAEEKQVEEPHLKDWLAKLRNTAFDIEDILETYATETSLRKRKQRVRNFRSTFSGIRDAYHESNIAHDIREISEKLAGIAEEKNKFHLNIINDRGMSQNLSDTTFFVDTNDVFGRDSDKETLINVMLSNEFDVEGDVSVIPIVGMGGLGKTTLAQLIFNDARVNNHFELRMWVCVTFHFNHKRILKEMINFLTETDSSELNASLLESRFLALLSGRKFFLVLDDVWIEDYQIWEPLQKLLRRGDQGSRVLITTRSNRVSNITGTQATHNLEYLPEDKCWSLFENIALRNHKFFGGTHGELENIGRKIVGKCKGLPLAVKAMAGLLKSNADVKKWEKILSHSIWELEEGNFDKPRILPALKLSYDHLPSNLKRCFAYCSLFPKAYVFDRKELVKLWMAEAFIESSASHGLEEAGTEYFDELLMRSFFNVSNLNNRLGYTMHDLTHDLALSVSSPQYCQVAYGQSGIFCEECRHASFHCEDLEKPISQIIEKSKKLRTFILHGDYLKFLGQDLDRMFRSLKYIRVLGLNNSLISELPSSIEELKLLRHLDLSITQIKVLPNSICNLYNLQTLKLLGCVWLSELPEDLNNLVNLCYLEVDEIFWFNCRMLPQKMGNLTALKKLNVFHVSDKGGHGIEALSNMAYLTAVHTSNLENAEDTKLNEKESHQKQVLDCRGRDVDELKSLQHHPTLEDLVILHFNGSNFSSWMAVSILQNLVSVSLVHCTKCKILSLGQLPCLRELYVKGMLELDEWPEDQYTSLCTVHIIKCPKLRKVPNCMPNLKILKIKKCDSLKALPMAPSLMFLVLGNNLVLDNCQPKPASNGPLELKIVNCPKIQALPHQCAPQKLEISGCELISVFPDSKFAQRLQNLTLDSCSSETLIRGLPNANSLYSLVMSNISNLTFVPKLPHLPGLKSLYISDCKCLTSFSQAEASLRSLSSLQLLSVQGCPVLESVPVDRLPTALECLMIGSCPRLKSLGAKETLKSLIFLKDLYMEDCPLVQYFPEEGLPPSLQHLKIHGCPLLIEECQRGDEGATEWQKIKHIPDLEIDSIKLSSAQMSQRSRQGFVDLFTVKTTGARA